jgi:hypothetical protein
MWEGFQITVYANKFPSNELGFHNFVKIYTWLLKEEHRFTAAEAKKLQCSMFNDFLQNSQLVRNISSFIQPQGLLLYLQQQQYSEVSQHLPSLTEGFSVNCLCALRVTPSDDIYGSGGRVSGPGCLNPNRQETGRVSYLIMIFCKRQKSVIENQILIHRSFLHVVCSVG